MKSDRLGDPSYDSTSRLAASGGRRRIALLACALGAALLLLLLEWYPEGSLLASYGIYAVPSHFLISVLPNEPALLFVAKYYPAWAVAVTGTAGCMLAGVLDYWLLAKLVNHPRIRPKLDSGRFFRWSLRVFRKAPFVMLVAAAVLPVPFYPFKFLAIAGGYPLGKYETALLVGRFPRFYALAWFGYVARIPDEALLIIAAVFIAMPLARPLLSKIWPGQKREPEPSVVLPPAADT